MTNMKSHMGFPLTPRSMTFDDLELLFQSWFAQVWCLWTLAQCLQQLKLVLLSVVYANIRCFSHAYACAMTL